MPDQSLSRERDIGRILPRYTHRNGLTLSPPIGTSEPINTFLNVFFFVTSNVVTGSDFWRKLLVLCVCVITKKLFEEINQEITSDSSNKNKTMKCLIFAVLFVAVLVQNSAAAPKYQILEPRDGYIPVYIRYGDEPLAGINPALAAAFHEPVNRVSRAELAQVLQRDESPNNTSSNSTSLSVSALSASDEHRIALAVAAEKARAAAEAAAAASAANKV